MHREGVRLGWVGLGWVGLAYVGHTNAIGRSLNLTFMNLYVFGNILSSVYGLPFLKTRLFLIHFSNLMNP